MAFSIGSIFATKPTVAAPPAAPAPVPGVTNNPANNTPAVGTKQGEGTAPNGVVPNDGSATGDKKEESPLANFATLWDTPAPSADAKDPNEQKGLDPQKIMEAAGKVDFAKVVNQETLAKITAGGPDAVAAMIDALNKTSQTVFAQSTIAAQRIADNAVSAAEERFNTQLPQAIRKQSLNSSLVGDNPAFANPAVKPLIDALQTQLAEKFPKATDKELKTMAQEYLTGASQIISPPQKDNSSENQKPGKDNVDWDKWLAT